MLPPPRMLPLTKWWNWMMPLPVKTIPSSNKDYTPEEGLVVYPTIYRVLYIPGGARLQQPMFTLPKFKFASFPWSVTVSPTRKPDRLLPVPPFFRGELLVSGAIMTYNIIFTIKNQPNVGKLYMILWDIKSLWIWWHQQKHLAAGSSPPQWHRPKLSRIYWWTAPGVVHQWRYRNRYPQVSH